MDNQRLDECGRWPCVDPGNLPGRRGRDQRPSRPGVFRSLGLLARVVTLAVACTAWFGLLVYAVVSPYFST